MDVEVKGSGSIENFVVVVHYENDSQTFNIAQELLIEADLGNEIDHCATKEHFWHATAIEARAAVEDFERLQYHQYCAWTQRFARYYLKGIGERSTSMTKELIRQTAAMIYSKDGMLIDKERHSKAAYKSYEEECTKVGVYPTPYDDFEEDMFHYDQPYEDWEKAYNGLKRKANHLEAIAEAFKEKAWSIKTKAADARARIGSNL